MGLNLLSKIPKISYTTQPRLLSHYVVHNLVFAINTAAFSILILLTPISKFPITFGSSKQKLYKCVPDFATGKVLTYQQTTSRFLRSI